MRAAPDDRFFVESDRADLRAASMEPIVAEASSEASRPPSYEELWSRRPIAPPRAPERRRAAPILPAVLATLIGAMALIGLREKLVAIAPPLALGYSALGLPVNLAGLDLRDVHSRIVMDGPRRVLAIEGEIANRRREPTAVPPLALTVRGEDGMAKYAWTSAAPKSRLEPFETVAFRARLAAPPESGADVLVRFAGAEEAPRGKPGKATR